MTNKEISSIYLISREALYNEIVRLEELARNRVRDTPSSSPCYMRYVAQLNERTALKQLVIDAPVAYPLIREEEND